MIIESYIINKMNKDIIIHLAGYCQPGEKDKLMKLNKLFNQSMKDRKLVIQKNPHTILKSHQNLALFEYMDDYAMVLFLLQVPISPNITNLLDLTPFHCALLKSNEKIMTLLSQYTNISTPLPILHPLHWEVYNNNVDMVKLLINSDLNIKTTSGNTPLWIAIRRKFNDVMIMLIDAGADINIADNHGVSPLHLLTQQGNINGITLLIEHGANINGTDYKGYASIDYAIMKKNKEMVKVLLDRGAEVGIKSMNRSYTSLMVAACWSCQFNLQLILDKNPLLINYENRYGWTALCWAVFSGQTNNVKFLLKYGASTNLNIKINWQGVNIGHTLLDIAKQKNDVNMISLLEDVPKTDSIFKNKHKKENCVIQ